MTKVIVELDIVIGKDTSKEVLTIGTDSKQVVGTETYLSPFLSVNLIDGRPTFLTTHSVSDTTVEPDKEVGYEMFLGETKLPIPEHGFRNYPLRVDTLFTYSESKFKHIKTVHARVISIE